MLFKYLLVGFGGFIGTVLRYWISGMVAERVGETFPWGTLIINVTGSFVVGFLATATDPDGRLFIDPNTRQFLLIGILGGYTTFSSFSLQTLNLARESEWLYAGGNVLLSVALCLIAVWFGFVLARLLQPAR